jgi:hypothetical protein
MADQKRSNDESQAALAIDGQEFHYNEADLMAENMDHYGYTECFVDYELVRFIGLIIVPGCTFVPPGSGFNDGLFGVGYGYYHGTEINYASTQNIGEHLLRVASQGGSATMELPFPLILDKQSTVLDFKIPTFIAKLNNGTKKWSMFHVQKYVQGGPLSTNSVSSLSGQDAKIASNPTGAPSVKPKGDYGMSPDEGLPRVQRASDIQEEGLQLPTPMPLYIAVPKNLPLSAVHVGVFGKHVQTKAHTHDITGPVARMAGVKGADAYAQLIFFHLETGTITARQFTHYFTNRLLNRHPAAAWNIYEDWCQAMKLYIHGHTAESMRALPAYRRVHRYLLIQLLSERQVNIETEPVASTVKAGAVVMGVTMAAVAELAPAPPANDGAGSMVGGGGNSASVGALMGMGEQMVVSPASGVGLNVEAVQAIINGVTTAFAKTVGTKVEAPLADMLARLGDVSTRLASLEGLMAVIKDTAEAKKRGLLVHGVQLEEIEVGLQIVGLSTKLWGDLEVQVGQVHQQFKDSRVASLQENSLNHTQHLRRFIVASMYDCTFAGSDLLAKGPNQVDVPKALGNKPYMDEVFDLLLRSLNFVDITRGTTSGGDDLSVVILLSSTKGRTKSAVFYPPTKTPTGGGWP